MSEKSDFTAETFNDLNMFEFRLLCYYRLIAAGGTAETTVRATAKACGMSPTMVMRARDSLRDKEYLSGVRTHHATVVDLA